VLFIGETDTVTDLADGFLGGDPAPSAPARRTQGSGLTG